MAAPVAPAAAHPAATHPNAFNGVAVIETSVNALAHLVPVYMPSVQAQFNAFQAAVVATQPKPANMAAPATPKK